MAPPRSIAPAAGAAPPADPAAPFLARAILAQAQASRTVIQDFCPLAQSLEWDLGQQYLRQRGNKAFLSDATPAWSTW